MSSTDPAPSPKEPSLEQQRRAMMTDSYAQFMHNTSLTMLFLAPALIALPPRKLDLYTFTLGGAFVLSANRLTRERTGRGILGTLGAPFRSELPTPRAEVFRDGLRKEEERRRLLEMPVSSNSDWDSASASAFGRSTSNESDYHRSDGVGARSELGAAAKGVWMGGDTEGWKEKRLKEEQEKLDQGEGYYDMIKDQIWEVWNWGNAKDEELIQEDKAMLKERQREAEFPKIGKKEK